MNSFVVFLSLLALAIATPQMQSASVLIPAQGGSGCVRCNSQASFQTTIRFQSLVVQCSIVSQENCPGCCGAYAISIGRSPVRYV
uniref:Secreted protein n=1 Tax=Ascaris lumbricoides TaxID=6252 RepID=A0A0M3HQW1_ASCLU